MRPNKMLERFSRVNVNGQDVNGNTPLHLAAQTNNLYAMECLIGNKDVDLSLRNSEGRNFIEEAI